MKRNQGITFSRRGFLSLAGGALIVSAAPALAGGRDDDPTRMLNAFRKANGVPPVATDPTLEKAALYQAKRMATHGKMGHSIGWGEGFVARLRQAGIHGPAAENVAEGQPDTRSVFSAWMKSPGHRRNMLDPEFGHYGLAWARPANNPGMIYWSMVLGL
ncbi:MAG: CAP domain-containing protein [Rhizobiales bacterium]|nr:CAP domain-containing protein [Hyphomicrobiales bacterium]OJY06560.1 MAG: alkaline phosphatase [Rhizobiales bacterium 63-22]